MKTKITFLVVALALLFSCSGDDDASQTVPVDGNSVLMLRVDYLTNVFEGGTELSFDAPSTSFTVTNQYMPPGDFGNVKLFYDELDTKIFDGDIIWMGLGTLHFPDDFQPADTFEAVITNDYVFPANGFEDVFNPSGFGYDYDIGWSSIQQLVKVRTYLEANPEATVKVFLYTPSVGVGDPADWDWFYILKN